MMVGSRANFMRVRETLLENIMKFGNQNKANLFSPHDVPENPEEYVYGSEAKAQAEVDRLEENSLSWDQCRSTLRPITSNLLRVKSIFNKLSIDKQS